jgi:membrane protein implicated in regulation of membrane protease activity
MVIEYIEFWIMLTIIFFLCELLTRKLYFLSLTFATITVTILNYLGYSLKTEITSFIIVFIIFALITRPIAKKIKKRANPSFEVNKFIGKEAIVKDYINKNQHGNIFFEGENWKAISNEELLEGALVTIIGADETYLVVEEKL